MQFILEVVKQFADTLHIYEAEQNCCQMKVTLKQKGIFSSWAHVNTGFLLDPGRQDVYSVISILVPAILSGGAYRYL